MCMQIGFIGLGNMGYAIARNLIRGGHELTVYNRTRSKAEALQADGAHIANTPAEVCAGGVVLTMLADDGAVEGVVLGENGIAEALGRDGLHVSLSTISPGCSRRIADVHGHAGQKYVAAPVFGRPDTAERAKLIVVAAGDPGAVSRAQPLFDAIGQKTFVVAAEPWKANVLKLSGNLLLAIMLESFGEIYALLRESGLDPKQWLEIVNGSVFRSPVFENYGNIIADERFDPAGFKLKLGYKDVKLALGAAEEVTVPMPFGSVLRDRFLAAIARGDGDKDWSAIARSGQ
ncbi:MAG TPA: NAD(P)-dependent oxidoreductase [Bryobacteraceae bacterium]|nr:NAD(P)-dependent oxidoreductase [Bryobacteraceae bacterium]